jgi:hypothetical protein
MVEVIEVPENAWMSSVRAALLILLKGFDE